jgi:hypothetical protein
MSNNERVIIEAIRFILFHMDHEKFRYKDNLNYHLKELDKLKDVK